MRKSWASLSAFDLRLRSLKPVVQSAGVQLRIDKLVGFELFNRTAFHNHETWSDGYRVVGPVGPVAWTPWPEFYKTARVIGLADHHIALLWEVASGQRRGLVVYEAEDLDDAVDGWSKRRDEVELILSESPPGPNQRTRLAVNGYHTTEGGEHDVGSSEDEDAERPSEDEGPVPGDPLGPG